MTADEFINILASTSLVGTKIGDVSVEANKTTLLALTNMAKDKVAADTLLWLGGETISMVEGTYEYTLSGMPIQIVDVYDANLVLRERNSQDAYGYYQTSPNKLKFNNITNGLDVNINYYETPSDYILTDTLNIPPTLINAMQYFVAHKAFEIYKSDTDIFYSKEYFNKYTGAVKDFISTTDSVDVDTVISSENKAWKRGIR